MEFQIIPLNLADLDSFRPYITTSALDLWQEDDQGVTAVGLVADDALSCGALVAVLEEDTLHIVSLYVDEAVRGQGLGRGLLEHILGQASPQWVEAHWMLPQGDYETVAQFFQHFGYETDSIAGDPVYRLDPSALEKHQALRPALSPNFRPDPNVISLRDMTPEERAELEQDTTIDPALQLDALEPEVWDSPISVAYRYGGKIGGYFTAIPTGDGVAILPVVVRENCHPGAFLAMAACAFHRALPYLQGGCCWTHVTNDHARNLAQWLGADPTQGWYEGNASWRKP